MSKTTDSSLFMVSPFARYAAGFYQQLLRSTGSYEAFCNRLILVGEHAHALRQFDQVNEIVLLLSNVPIKRYQAIGYYFLAVAANSVGNGDQDKAQELFELAVDTAPDTYKVKSILSLGALAGNKGDIDSAFYFYQEVAKSEGLGLSGLEAMRGIAVMKAAEGYHQSAIIDLEKILPTFRFTPPHVYLDCLNSYAVELSEVGRSYEAEKVSSLVLREAMSKGYLSRLPHYNSVFRYLESEALTPYLYELIGASAQPLKSVETDFAVDSSGFSAGQFMRWFDVKYGKKEDRRMWLKVHLMCGVKTNIVTSVEISDGYANDHSFFKPLVDQTAERGFKMEEISGDKAYLSGENFLTTIRHGATPYIPFKTNSTVAGTYSAKSTLWTRMFHFYNLHREEYLTHYHKRSNVETTFHMIKAKFGQRLRSKTLTAQINEALCKVLCHNLCVVIQSAHELGVDSTFGAEIAFAS
jgi:transposase